MGGGVGLSAHGRHRVVTERTRLAMPEVGLGFFPDVGGTWLLSRSPGEIGTYFGLTGQTMNGPDAIYAGFADAVVPSAQTGRLARGAGQARRRATLRPDVTSRDRRLCRPARPPAPSRRCSREIDALLRAMTAWRISSPPCSATARNSAQSDARRP